MQHLKTQPGKGLAQHMKVGLVPHMGQAEEKYLDHFFYIGKDIHVDLGSLEGTGKVCAKTT